MSWFLDPAPLYETSQYITRDPVKPVRFVQVFQAIPALEPFYTEWEKHFDVSAPFRAIRDSKWVPIMAVILYLSFLVEGKKYIERRKKEGKGPVNLGYFPALWNGFLALFSIAGALRVVPHFLFLFTHKDFKETVCEAPDAAGYGDGAAGLWVMLFTVSKVFELMDTVILVLKGKDPMFLHW
jgi:elongation of very long chain fatty acids protein 6